MNRDLEKIKKKKIGIRVSIVYGITISLLIIGCGINNTNSSNDIISDNTLNSEIENNNSAIKDNGYVKYMNDNERTLTFVVNEPYIERNTEGGSGYSYISCHIVDTSITVYLTSVNTTADNGTTVKYLSNIDSNTYNKIYELCSEITDENEIELFNYVYDLIRNNNNGEVVSYGMNDSDSRNIDGSYKWQEEFKSLY